MKGLLLKDWYMAKKYCRAHLLIAIVFIAASIYVGEENMFFITYPCIFIATVPTVLLSYDERCKWDEYCGTLPCSKKQFVSEKFLVGLIVTLPLIIITAVIFAVRAGLEGHFNFGETIEIVSVLAIISAFVSSVTLPFMIKLGVEKGRIAYYVMIGVTTALAVLAPNIIGAGIQKEMTFAFAPVAIAAALALYVLSWKLSVKLYENREL